MNKPNKDPNYIFTSFLSISHFFISQTGSTVTILGCYGNMINGEIESISIETDFATVNDLLAEAGAEADEAIEKIAELLVEPSNDNYVINLSDSGGLTFHDNIFAFLEIFEFGIDGKRIESGENSYRLNAYIKRQNILPDFISTPIPDNDVERSVYFNSMLAAQYHIFLHYRKKQGENTALVYANLTDPFYFELAKTQYDLQKSGQRNS